MTANLKAQQSRTHPATRSYPQRRLKSWASFGLLRVVFICLILSGVLRFGAHSVALAKETLATDTPGPASLPTVPRRVKSCAQPPDIAALLSAIKARNHQLDQRESTLAARMKALKAEEQATRQDKAALLKAEARLRATLALANSAAEKDIQKLTAVYENMKPRNSAGLFATMDPKFAAGFLARMRPEAAARIMSSLPPQRAYAISLVIAGRNANIFKKSGG